MKCLSIVTLFGLIAIATAGTQRLDEVNHQYVLHRVARQTQFSSSSSSSSSSLAQPGQPIVFHQTSSSYNSFIPDGSNAANAANAGNAANTNTNNEATVNLADRFGPEESDTNSTSSDSQTNNKNNAPTGNAQTGNANIPFGASIPYGQFPGANPYVPYGGIPQYNGAPPPQFGGAAPNYGNAPVFSQGHFSSVAGQYDPNTQQTVIYHNYNQKLK